MDSHYLDVENLEYDVDEFNEFWAFWGWGEPHLHKLPSL